ncbi:indolethylamine N-methyltransferase-like [Discoglossus pictus]
MDPRPRKMYHEDEFDISQMVHTYHSSKADNIFLEDIVFNCMRQLHKELGSGRIKGDTLIDFTLGPIIYHLFTISEFFEDITVLETNDTCIKELEKWMNMDPDAFDWSHASKYIAELEGNSAGWKKKEETVKQSIKQILKCNFEKENPTDPVVLPKVDCLLTGCALDLISKDQEQYSKNLKKFSRWLKLGGHLILIGVLNASFYMVGEHKIHFTTYNEDVLKKLIVDAGYVIESFEMTESKLCSDVADHEHMVFITALKEREA